MATVERKHTEYLQYHFTPEEKQEIATALAQANQSRSEIEKRKAQVTADFKAQITALEATIDVKSRLYNNGYDYRDIECRVDLHIPVKGKKQVWRLDTGELVKEVLMTAAELQQKLAFDEEPAVEEPALQGADAGPEADEPTFKHKSQSKRPEANAE